MRTAVLVVFPGRVLLGGRRRSRGFLGRKETLHLEEGIEDSISYFIKSDSRKKKVPTPPRMAGPGTRVLSALKQAPPPKLLGACAVS